MVKSFVKNIPMNTHLSSLQCSVQFIKAPSFAECRAEVGSATATFAIDELEQILGKHMTKIKNQTYALLLR